MTTIEVSEMKRRYLLGPPPWWREGESLSGRYAKTSFRSRALLRTHHQQVLEAVQGRERAGVPATSSRHTPCHKNVITTRTTVYRSTSTERREPGTSSRPSGCAGLMTSLGSVPGGVPLALDDSDSKLMPPKKTTIEAVAPSHVTVFPNAHFPFLLFPFHRSSDGESDATTTEDTSRLTDNKDSLLIQRTPPKVSCAPTAHGISWPRH